MGIYLEKKKKPTNLKSHIHCSIIYNSQDTESAYVLFTTAKIQKQPKYPSVDAWIKMYIYIQYYSAIKMNEILPLAAICTDPEGIK